MKIPFHNKTDAKKGFTLVETLVAIGILVTAIAAPLSIANMGLQSARYAQDSLTAQMLVIEAIEYVRNIRDDNYLRGQSWENGLRVNEDPFWIDTVQNSSGSCAGGSCDGLFISFNSDRKLYSYQSGSGWSPSVFTRSIEVDRLNSREIIVRASVSWERHGRSHTYSAREHLLNWYE